MFFNPFSSDGNAQLYLESGATLWGSTNLKDYPTDSLIYAEKAQNIAIMGRGRVHGNGEHFWPDPQAEEPRGWRAKLERPHNLILLVECRDIKIQDIFIESTPCWNTHLLACDRAMIRGVTVKNPLHGPNADGITLNACRDVTILVLCERVCDTTIEVFLEEYVCRSSRQLGPRM